MSSGKAILETIDSRLTIELRSDPTSRSRDLANLGASLCERPRWIRAKFFYDRRGSELFERITELPEYYQTRTEEALLARVAPGLVQRIRPDELLELGSGAATKTRVLLDAMAAAGTLARYVPIDVDPSVTRRVSHELLDEYPNLEIHAIIADLMAPLASLPAGRHRLVIFLGGTIGNLNNEACDRFLGQLAAVMSPGDHVLLGVDRIKDVARLEAAYNDRAGVTADFNRNMLNVVNEFADGDFSPAFEHVAFYNEALHRIEMWLRAVRAQTVHLGAIDLTLDLDAGEAILTEISTKYDRPLLEPKLERNHFELEEWHTDDEGLFALALARRVERPSGGRRHS